LGLDDISVPYGWKPKRKSSYTPRPRVKLEKYPWLDGLRNGGRKKFPEHKAKSMFPDDRWEQAKESGENWYSFTRLFGGLNSKSYAIATDFETLVENIENGNIRLYDDTSESVYIEPDRGVVWMLVGGQGY